MSEKILTITKNDLDANNFYIGKEDVTNFNGSIVIEENLGYVNFFKNLYAQFSILAKAGSGIEAGGALKQEGH